MERKRGGYAPPTFYVKQPPLTVGRLMGWIGAVLLFLLWVGGVLYGVSCEPMPATPPSGASTDAEALLP